MRLWHSKLIPLLDNKRLSDVHMSCCNLRGKGWGKKNVSINYLYDDPLGEEALAVYHSRVLVEMYSRGFNFQIDWYDPAYCGKNREARVPDLKKLYEARCRDVPLLGHTLDILQNDVRDLKDRGLHIVAVIDPIGPADNPFGARVTLYRDHIKTAYEVIF